MAKRPPTQTPLALTMGDAAGVGPAIAALAWRSKAERNIPPFAFIGAPEALSANDRCLPIIEIEALSEATEAFDKGVPVLALDLEGAVVPGEPNPGHAKAAITALDIGIDAALSGKARALVTGPVSKEALLAAGFKHAGHTGYLGAKAKTTPVMMLANQEARTVPVTVHVSLKGAIKALSKKLIVETGEIVHRDLQERFGIANPRLAATGLNPHAGEAGRLGTEEQKIIIPALEALRAKGVAIEGPLPADTAFTPANRMRFDAVLAMTHDQALIPVKTLDFRGAVNITLGLPFVRTSPAHGTAFDLLRRGGTPDPESTIQALLMADRLAS